MTQSSSDDPANPVEVADEQGPARLQVFRSKVYRGKGANDWIVEPPRNMVAIVDKVAFTGPAAQHRALTYAYEKFGNARFFPY